MSMFLRVLGAMCAIVALALSLYMAGIAAHDKFVRHELQSDSVGPFSDSLCHEIRGCLGLTVEPRYDWMKATMTIAYHIRLANDSATKEEIADTVKRVADAQTGLFGWALHTSQSTLDVATTPVLKESR